MKRFLITSLLALVFGGCYYDVNVKDKRDNASLSPDQTQRPPESGYINGETVTTPNGVVVKGTFGEIAERKTLPNGVVIEGVFFR